jgi:hypothetical protein
MISGRLPAARREIGPFWVNSENDVSSTFSSVGEFPTRTIIPACLPQRGFVGVPGPAAARSPHAWEIGSTCSTGSCSGTGRQAGTSDPVINEVWVCAGWEANMTGCYTAVTGTCLGDIRTGTCRVGVLELHRFETGIGMGQMRLRKRGALGVARWSPRHSWWLTYAAIVVDMS